MAAISKKLRHKGVDKDLVKRLINKNESDIKE
jgi:hypothetical protein